jgi:hypothetical protein
LSKLPRDDAVVSVGTRQICPGDQFAFVQLSDLFSPRRVRDRSGTDLGSCPRRHWVALPVFWPGGIEVQEPTRRATLARKRRRRDSTTGSRTRVRDQPAHAVFESVSNRLEGGLYDGKLVVKHPDGKPRRFDNSFRLSAAVAPPSADVKWPARRTNSPFKQALTHLRPRAPQHQCGKHSCVQPKPAPHNHNQS